MLAPGVPRYSLYGEPEHGVDDRFIHVETIARRSAAADWTIRPHSHGELEHLLIVERGGGEMLVDGDRVPFARSILAVPAGVAHGFRFDCATEGHIVTVAGPLLRRIATSYSLVRRLITAARVLPLPEEVELRPMLDALMAETASTRPLNAMAGEALLQLLLVSACRLVPEAEGQCSAPRRPALLVSRYRLQIDRHLRDGWSIAHHASALGTSIARLRAACVEVTGAPPIQLMQNRLIAEARRQLAYTDRTVAEVGYDLGFGDPAYFSRFFRRCTGVSPGGWRMDQSSEKDSASIAV
ncbi:MULTISPECIES: helix-turn-helix domain-containing protein [unclassified Sphingomonas]|uniref:helix-turn-helix domain-containing protein n=1 Tax=unclassified Sphingomonas TaxID=196159 RepID=UPI0006F72663|nr:MULTISPECIES: helix-turn-helix domain-containing protein [unclassified Sphingomonas]KRB78776.1 hypothetical protein ASE00_21340 [Sphingomonas sp. Root710]